ncbi:hypothetical protein [Microtetraspora malaysiensis]|uniref:hypothetical protein n=1 Tax=Microtetraspora malaysiensis TaxID=161358 RepID=UPI000836DA07|nr:hypothetical protein [Microtetraspora malaysiensis]
MDRRVTALEGQVKTVSHFAGLAQRRYEATAQCVALVQVEIKVLRTEMNERFDALGECVGKLEQRMDRFEQRMDRFEERMDRFDERLTNVEDRLTNVENRLTRVEQRLDGVEVILKSHGEMLREILQRLPSAA